MGLLSANSQFVVSLYSFYGFLSQSYNLSLYTDKIRTFFETKSTIETETAIDLNVTNDEMITDVNAFSIELINVSFSYSNSNFSLKNINMKIKPGERIAIVGENGAGKTTLVKLLLRLYDVDEGKILINNKQIKDYDIKLLRGRIGVAFQKPNIQ